MRFFIVLSFLLSSSAFAAQIDSSKLLQCAQIKDDKARLSCFDDLSLIVQVGRPDLSSRSFGNVGNWEVSIDNNPVDDSTTVTLFLKASSGTGKFDEPIFLAARCKQNKTDFYVNWNQFLGINNTKILTRIGKNPAKTNQWQTSTDYKASFAPSPIPLLKEMLSETTFLTQTIPHGESQVTAIFDITGLQNAIKPLRETCGW